MKTWTHKFAGLLATAGLLTLAVVAQEAPAPPKAPKPAAKPRPAASALPSAPMLRAQEMLLRAVEFAPLAPLGYEAAGLAAEGYTLAPLTEVYSLEFEHLTTELEMLGSSLVMDWAPLASVGIGQSSGVGWSRASRDEERERQRAQRRRARELRNEERRYSSGKRHLDKKRWERAVEEFDRVAQAGGKKADGALFWKAYAQHKMGSGDEAMGTLQTLKTGYPQSRWLNDAKVLEAEIQRRGSQPVDPESVADEELKELALRNMIHVECSRAAPVLEKFLKGSQSPKLKERALFVLAQKMCPEGFRILSDVAKGGSNPDLQIKAIQYLGIHGGKENRALLAEIYNSGVDIEIRKRILKGFMVARDKERLLEAARTEQNEELRGTAVQQLGIMRARAELRELYQAESSVDVKKKILQGMFISNDVDGLDEVARTETVSELRLRAVRNMGLCGDKRAGGLLLTIYNSDQDIKVRKEVLKALFLKQDDKALIAIARKETNPELKKEAVKRLSLIKSKAVTEYLMEILNQ